MHAVTFEVGWSASGRGLDYNTGGKLFIRAEYITFDDTKIILSKPTRQ